MDDLMLQHTVEYRVCRNDGAGWDEYLEWTESLEDALACLLRMRQNYPEEEFKTQERYVSRPYETED